MTKLPNFERSDATKIAGKIQEIHKYFWTSLLRLTCMELKEKVAHHTLWIREE